jgi:hypothetical protein
MSIHTYSLDPSQCRNISLALKEAGFSMRHSVEDGDGEITITFFDDLSTEQESTLDAFMAIYDGDVWTAQNIAKANIDHRTQELLARGFEHDGHRFSLSLAAQANWNRMITKHAAGTLVLPTDKVSTSHGLRHSFADAAAFEAFESAYTSAVEDVLEGGRLLKDQINAAATVEDVNAVVDSR